MGTTVMGARPLLALSALSLVALMLAACGSGGAPVEPDGAVIFGSLPGRIVFSSFREGSQDIFVMNGDSTGQRRLTADPVDAPGPAWPPALPGPARSGRSRARGVTTWVRTVGSSMPSRAPSMKFTADRSATSA